MPARPTLLHILSWSAHAFHHLTPPLLRYGYRLGPPLGKAVLLTNGTYHREFESGTVVNFDTLTGLGAVSWASKQSVYSPISDVAIE